jgi:hypothetical protein
LGSLCCTTPTSVNTAINESPPLLKYYTGWKVGLCYLDGKEFLKPTYDDIVGFAEDRAPVRLGKQWGFLDRAGRLVIDTRYQAVHKFVDGLAAVSLPDRGWGFITKDGLVAIRPGFYYTDGFSPGTGLASAYVREGAGGYINHKGQWVIKPVYKLASPFWEGLALVKDEISWHYIDLNGDNVINLEPSIVPVDLFTSLFHQGLACVIINNQYGYINTHGKVVITPQYEDASPFSEGLAAVKLNGKWGFINTRGERLIPPTFDFCCRFSEGLARVTLQGKEGFINHSGHIVIKPEYDWVSPSDFRNGVVEVSLGSYRGYIDKSGRRVLWYQHIYPADDSSDSAATSLPTNSCTD